MTRRAIAFVLALTIASGAQGTLMYAAAAPADPDRVAAGSVDQLVNAMSIAPAVPGADALGSMLAEGAVQCQRGAHYCFGYFSYNCCAEMAALIAIAGAVGAWAAAGVGAYYYWYYC